MAGLVASVLALAFLFAATAARAQVPTLDRVDSLITAGAFADARADLERWWSARDHFDVPASDRARGLFLRAQLAPDPAAAEPDYLAVVLGYPTSPQAPEALLRLGQGILAAGDPGRAAAYLQRLVADYPGRSQRPQALLWLARASTAARRPAAACEAASAGVESTNDPDLSEMLRVEAAASCSIRTASPAAADRRGPATAAARTETDPPTTGTIRDEAATGDWAVQAGAFRYNEGATALMERLRAAGFSPRLVRVPRNDLLRVRVGRFATSADGAAVIRRLQQLGFDAVVVNDAAQERQP